MISDRACRIYLRYWNTYLIICLCKFLVIIDKFEYLVMMYFANSRRVIEKIHLLLRRHHLLLLVIFCPDCEAHSHLYELKIRLNNHNSMYTTKIKEYCLDRIYKSIWHIFWICMIKWYNLPNSKYVIRKCFNMVFIMPDHDHVPYWIWLREQHLWCSLTWSYYPD